MPLRSSVHFSKKEAILQLCNFLCASSISNITELADGQILVKTIQNKFPEFYNHSSENCAEVKSSNDEMDVVQSKEESNDTSEKLNDESYPAKEENILIQLNCIQKFIDDCYKIKSSEIISYTECTKLSELEITKIAIFVLSEIVRQLLEIDKEHLQTLFHLDVRYQVELEDCFKTFISERDKISKEVVEKLLSKSARKSSPFITPRRTSSRRKEQKSVSPATPKEDIFTNSPLKVYFESPIFKKEDILMKEKQIENLKKILDEEDEESSKLQHKLSEMEKELKMKDKNCKQLEKQVVELNKEIQVLQTTCQSEACKAEMEKLLTKFNESERRAIFLTDRIVDLNNENVELCKKLEKASLEDRVECMESFSQPQGSSTPNRSPKETGKLHLEIGFLKERIKCLELKIFSYKKQLSAKVITELKEKKNPRNLNESYEELWKELDKERKEEGEILSTFIEEDNRILRAKLNEEICKNNKLVEEMQILKEKATSKHKKSIQQKFASTATMTDAPKMPELIDVFKTPEIEKLRNSVNHSENMQHCPSCDEPSYNLNNSDNFIPCEQSLHSPELVVMPCPEKSSEAVLWKMYDSQMYETEGTYVAANLCDDTLSETSNLDMVKDLEICKIRNAETSMLPNQENEYVLGNLNFDAFLNELKKLTKNGSFQKVLQVFGKCQRDINGANSSNRLDLQEMLKMITECVCTAVTLNAESSVANREDKCCLTNENELSFVNQSIELNQMKNKLTATSEELQKCKYTVEELNQKNNLLELEIETCNQKLIQKIKALEEVVKKYQDLSIKCDNNERRLMESKAAYKRLLDLNKKQYNDNLEVKRRAHYLNKKRNHFETVNKVLTQQNDSLKEELKKLKEEVKNLSKEISKIKDDKEKTSKEMKKAPDATSTELYPSRDSCFGLPNHLALKSEMHSSTFQDTANESVLSGALHKNISYYISENEDDFTYYNSLDVIKKDFEHERVEELKRRNSVLPFHLQSSYPIEGDLQTSYDSLYVKDDKKFKEVHGCKKRKCDDDPILEDDSSSNKQFKFHTPKRILVKPKKKLKTPNSIEKFIKLVHYRRTFPKKS